MSEDGLLAYAVNFFVADRQYEPTFREVAHRIMRSLEIDFTRNPHRDGPESAQTAPVPDDTRTEA
jgi:hypothetical protein